MQYHTGFLEFQSLKERHCCSTYKECLHVVRSFYEISRNICLLIRTLCDFETKKKKVQNNTVLIVLTSMVTVKDSVMSCPASLLACPSVFMFMLNQTGK